MIKKVELIIEKTSIDLFGDESFPLSFSIDEINDIGKKASGYSKEINIPATQLNNETFTSLFDVTVEGGFNPISRKTSILLVDGVPVMKGYFKLLGVNIKNNEYVTYRGLLYEEQINFIQALDEYELTNLNMPATGTTTSMVGPYTLLADFNITNVFSSSPGSYPGRTPSGGDWADAYDYNTLAWTGSTYGVISSQARMPVSSGTAPNAVTIPAGYYWNGNMNAYEASSDQYVEIRGVFKNRTIPSTIRVYSWRIVKSDYTSPLSGLYTDTVIAQGNVPFQASAGISIVTQTVDTGTWGVQLGAGDKVRIECWVPNVNINVSTPPNESYITGKVYSGAMSSVTGETFTLPKVMQNIENTISSDNATVAFPLIDYSKLYKFSKLNPNLYNWSNNPSLLALSVEDLRPTIFVKKVWDTIFKQAGFKYKSNFLNSDTFKKMIVAGGVDESEISSTMMSTIVNQYRTNYDYFLHSNKDTEYTTGSAVSGYDYNELHMGNAPAQVTTGTTQWFTTQSLVDAYTTYAPGNKFNHSNAYTTPSSNGTVTANGTTTYYGYGNLASGTNQPYGYFPTAAKDGKYRIKAKMTFTSYPSYQLSNPTVLQNFATRYSLQVQKMSVGSYKHINTFTCPSYNNWSIEKNFTVSRTTGTTNEVLTIEFDEIVDMKKGDMLRVAFYGDPNAQQGITTPAYGSKVTIDKAVDKTFMEFGKLGTILNTTITNYATLLPRGFKQRDFILQIAKLFNLYFETDKEDSKSILIEPRDTYYESGVIRDWTKKIDYSKDLQIDILSHDFAKTTTFKYKDDSKDYYSTKYEEYSNNGQPFASYIYTSPNEYQIDDSTLDSKFAPSYIQRLDDTNIKITKIIDPSKMEADGATKTAPYKIEPRIMMYKKKAISLPQYYYIGISIAQTIGYTPYTSTTSTSGFNTQGSYLFTNYGYAGHLDDPDNPTFDLNWFTDFTYLPGTTGTTQNLINIFYKQQLIELTDASARKMTCYVDLQPVDIHNLRFSDVYYFHKEYWRLLNISDYDTSSDVAQTTKCEFIKIVRAQTNQLIDYAAFGYLGINGGTGGGITGGIFGATDPETGQPLLMRLNGTQPVSELTTDTYFDIVAEKNVLSLDVITKAGGLGVLTQLSPNVRFESVQEQSLLNTNNIMQLNSLVANPPTGDIFYINVDTIPSDVRITEGYKTIMFDGVNDRSVLYQIELPVVYTDGYTVKFDIKTDGDFGIVDLTNANIIGNELYVVNAENKFQATYILAEDIWTVKRF